MTDTPDAIVEHKPNYCACCGEDLGKYEAHFVGHRQAIDMPPIQPIVTDHQVFRIHCQCGHANQGSYPAGIIPR